MCDLVESWGEGGRERMGRWAMRGGVQAIYLSRERGVREQNYLHQLERFSAPWDTGVYGEGGGIIDPMLTIEVDDLCWDPGASILGAYEEHSMIDVCAICNSDDIQRSSGYPPPILYSDDYESWSQRIRLYVRGKENGLQILQSIDQGTSVCLEPQGKHSEPTPEGCSFWTKRPSTYAYLSDTEKETIRCRFPSHQY
ncbi:hypothetical protein Tco_1575222 [Tanacetum coccineum]